MKRLAVGAAAAVMLCAMTTGAAGHTVTVSASARAVVEATEIGPRVVSVRSNEPWTLTADNGAWTIHGRPGAAVVETPGGPWSLCND